MPARLPAAIPGRICRRPTSSPPSISGCSTSPRKRLADPQRDIYIQSKGHGVGGLYCCLAEAGYFPPEWLDTYQHFDSHLPGHPVRQKTPGIELNTGALGHGLPVATRDRSGRPTRAVRAASMC